MLKPDYTNCIANIPAKVLELAKKKKTVLIVIDSLGYENLMKIRKKSKVVEKILKKFKIKKITSVFPTTTSAAVTALRSGQHPQDHGLYEWIIYSHELNMRIFPLPFMPVDEKDERQFNKKASKRIITHKSIFKEMRKNGISTYEITPIELKDSIYSSINKADYGYGYKKPYEIFIKLKNVVENAKKKSVFYVYLPYYDGEEHNNGPYSEEAIAVIETIFERLERDFLNKVKNVNVLITADHGCIEIKKEINLQSKKWFKTKIKNSFKKVNKKSILPTGSPRDLILHINPEKKEFVINFLKKKVGKYAEIKDIDKMIKENFFGNKKPSPKFLLNIGNVMILPKKGILINFEGESGYKGMHGGLSKEELFVPLLELK